jgi:hypothetical protein
MKRFAAGFLALLLAALPAAAEEITLATWNIEHFAAHFEAMRLQRSLAGEKTDVGPMVMDLIARERAQNDEDLWEIARVLMDRNLSPDIVVIQECCDERELKLFNNRWLRGSYETVIVFPGNSGRGQNLGIMLKPGFAVVERRDQYYLEPDPQPNPRGQRLFARGPAFVKVRTSAGYEFWVGTTHQKSKLDNDHAVASWRYREAKRTHEILRELEQAGPSDVILLGDMNDELGEEDLEAQTGGDTIATLLGGESPHFILATRELAESGATSFGGYWRSNYRSMIDHIVVSKSVKDQIREVFIFDHPLASVASDHYPVALRITPDPPPATQPAK